MSAENPFIGLHDAGLDGQSVDEQEQYKNAVFLTFIKELTNNHPEATVSFKGHPTKAVYNHFDSNGELLRSAFVEPEDGEWAGEGWHIKGVLADLYQRECVALARTGDAKSYLLFLPDSFSQFDASVSG